MKILWISNITDETVVKTSRIELANALRKIGHELVLIYAKDIGEKKVINEKSLYLPKSNSTPFSGFIYGLTLFFYLPLLVRKKNFDVIIIDAAKVWFPFILTLILLHIPMISDIRSLPVDKEKSFMFDISLNLSKFFVDGFMTITPELKEVIKYKYKLYNKNIGIWSSGVSIKNFNKTSIDKEITKRKSDSNSFILMYHGGYSLTRGIENIIISISEIEKPIREKIKFIIIGFSPYEPSIYPDQLKKLPNLCQSLGLLKQIEFISQKKYEDIPKYISICDVGIITLPVEHIWWQVSSPLKTLEYLAMGKPIIATNIPFHKKIFEKGKCGILLENNNPKEIANAITYLYQNKDKLNEMGKIGKEIVKNNYTWDNKAKEVENFIKTVLAGY